MKNQPLLLSLQDTTETPVLSAVLVALSVLPETMLWRHNSGAARTVDGRWIKFGLTGSGDIIGCHQGRAIAIETKRPKGGRFSESQINFSIAWRKAGGLYIPARSAEEALDALRHS